MISSRFFSASILDGEVLVGAKQNRVANLSIMLPPATDTVIPVSCVEACRWSYASDNFQALREVPPFNEWGNVIEIAARFGGGKELRSAVTERANPQQEPLSRQSVA